MHATTPDRIIQITIHRLIQTLDYTHLTYDDGVLRFWLRRGSPRPVHLPDTASCTIKLYGDDTGLRWVVDVQQRENIQQPA